MVLYLPLVVVALAQLATLASWAALRKTYDSDFYLPGGVAFGPQGQNRKLILACFLQLLAWTAYGLWLGHLLPASLNLHKLLGVVAIPYMLAMWLLISVGRHLGRFSDLRMTRPDGSQILPLDLMRPLSLAVNAYATLVLLVPLLFYLT
ncbi:hypothetical protein JST97_00600 [bacterium]|nr:hypothetical protein [bacterium]